MGANKGIGLEIARQLDRQGMTVLVGARDAGRGREAAEGLRSEGINAHCTRIDVTTQATIDQVAHCRGRARGRGALTIHATMAEKS
jgi:NAD(P)-dependent dehydrogenase (short-subunit alcohol dehydrogenase family)